MASKPVAVLLTKFSNQPQEPRPVKFYRDYFTEAGAKESESAYRYWLDVSYGTIDMTGSKVFGWLTSTQTTEEAAALVYPAGRGTLAQWGIDAATAASIDVSTFAAVLVLYNVPTDHGSAGGNRVVISYEAGRWEPTFIFHEMGHGFGLPHSFSRTPETEYGDRWDIMSAMNVWTFSGKFDAVVGQPNVRLSGPGMSAPYLQRRRHGGRVS